jgi:hypothetical protein
MSKYTEGFPTNFPKWNERYPCPTEVTLYMSSIAIKKASKSWPMPPEPDFERIFKEYAIAQL